MDKKKNDFEIECCRKVHEGYESLKNLIRGGFYHHKDAAPAADATPEAHEALFLRHFRKEIEPYFEKINPSDIASLDTLSWPKATLLFCKHAHAAGFTDAVLAAHRLAEHNLSSVTYLPDGTEIGGNKSLTEYYFQKLQRSIDDASIAFEATVLSAITFDPELGFSYNTHYGAQLRGVLSHAKEAPPVAAFVDPAIFTKISSSEPGTSFFAGETYAGLQAMEQKLIREKPHLERCFRLMHAYHDQPQESRPSYENLGAAEQDVLTKERVRQLIVRGLKALREEAQKQEQAPASRATK